LKLFTHKIKAERDIYKHFVVNMFYFDHLEPLWTNASVALIEPKYFLRYNAIKQIINIAGGCNHEKMSSLSDRND